jgi:hypothetical protein
LLVSFVGESDDSEEVAEREEEEDLLGGGRINIATSPAVAKIQLNQKSTLRGMLDQKDTKICPIAEPKAFPR